MISGTGRKSILRQFLTPILLAVLLVGISVASLSKWASDRSSRIASAARMRSIGGVVAQGSYPKSANVLENLQNLTGLDFILFRRDDRLQRPLIQESTLKLTDEELNQVQISVETPGAKRRESETEWSAENLTGLLYEGTIGGQAARWIVLPTDIGWLTIIEAASRRGDGWLVFILPLLTGLLSSIGIAIVAAWTAGKLSRRIENLRLEVANFAEGKFLKRELEGPDDDVRSLQSSLYRMGEQLDDSRKQIAVNERSRLIHMLGSGLAHELRNHLTGARLALQTVDVKDADQESITICMHQLDLAETQIRRLLAVRSEIQQQDQTPMTVRDVLNSAVALVRPVASHQNVKLDVFSPEPPNSALLARMDALQANSKACMVSVIVNLLINAVEAANVGGCVQIQVEVVSILSNGEAVPATELDSVNAVRWVVRDNGPGPKGEIVKTMFEPFATTKPEGVGLGLAMCKQVVQSIGGSIEWTRDKDWTEFEIVTPCRK